MLNLFSILLVSHIIIYLIAIPIILVIMGYIIFYMINLSLQITSDMNQYNSHPLDLETLNNEIMPLGFAYFREQDFFFSIMYPWQRKYGYCKAYDDIAPLFCMIIDCEPVYFNYDNRNWLIEFWKGQYGMTTGAEIGVYVSTSTSPKKEEIIYDSVSDSELLKLSYELKFKDNTLLKRNNIHWWLTGFKLGFFSNPSDLVMDINIGFKDNLMKEAFIEGLKKTGYSDDDINVGSYSVSFTFRKPYTKQSITKNKLITYFAQIYNKHNCRIYNKITRNYDNSLDKLNYIKAKFPILFNRALKIGKSRKIYDIIK